MEVLEKWYEEISKFEKLKIKEAQELYKKAINTSDENLRKTYMDKLILGTLYVVYNYIKRSNLKIFITSSYDMNDIISSFNQAWIKKIYSGDLLNVDNYSLLFTTPLFNDVYNNLCGDEILVNEQFGISIDCFVELLLRYIENRNKSYNIDFNDIIEKYYGHNSLRIYEINFINRLKLLFEKICVNLSSNEEDLLNLNKTKIFNYIRLIINMAMVESIPNNYVDQNNMEDNILTSIMLDHFVDDVDEVFKDERMKQIIHERYGLDEKSPLGLEVVGKIHNISRERVRQIEAKAIRKLRISNNIRKYKGES